MRGPTTELLLESADEYGWDPTWLNLPPDCWGQVLVDAVLELQGFYGLEPSGLPGEGLYRRMVLERFSFAEPNVEPQPTTPSDCILVAGERRPIPWGRVVTPDEEGGREIARYYTKKGKRKRRYKARSVPLPEVRRVTVHWTVTRSASHTWRVAWSTRRSVSTHFEINWDGTIYQLLDVIWHAFHSGVGTINDLTIGVDLTNPVGQKATARWNEKLVEMNQTPRPVVDEWRIRGWDPGRFLGPTPMQLEALSALALGLNRWCGVPLVAPLAKGPKRISSLKVRGHSLAQAKVLVPEGWHHHAEVRPGKWDHAGMYLPALLEQARLAA